MTEHHESTMGAILRILGYTLAWLGSWKLGDVQALAGILSALAVGGLAGLNAYVLWRDRIARRGERDAS